MTKFYYEWFFAWVRALAFPLVYWWECKPETLAEDPQEDECSKSPSSFFLVGGSLEEESLARSTFGIPRKGR